MLNFEVFPMFHSELSTIGKVAFPLFTEEVAKSQRTVVHLNLRNH